MLTNSDIKNIIKMRKQGYTYQQIAKTMGISKATVAKYAPKGVYNKSVFPRCDYPNLKKWIDKNKMSLTKMSKITGLSDDCLKYTFRKEREPTKHTIDCILKMTGLTYEICFKE